MSFKEAALVAPATSGAGPIPDLEIMRVERDALAFARFAFPQRRPQLSTLTPPWIAIGARWRKVPVGLGVMHAAPGGLGWIESISIERSLRNRGVGRALAQAVVAEARLHGVPRLTAAYSNLLPARAPLEAVLTGAGMSPPRLLDVQVVGLAGHMAEQGGAWRPVKRILADPGDYRFEPFPHSPAAEGEDFARIIAEDPQLGVSNPADSPKLDRTVSVVVREKRRLVGWVEAAPLRQSVGHGTIVSEAPSTVYIGARLAEGHHKALILTAFFKAFSAQAQRDGPLARAVYRTHPGAAAMLNFTRLHFAPMAISLEERWTCGIDLVP